MWSEDVACGVSAEGSKMAIRARQRLATAKGGAGVEASDPGAKCLLDVDGSREAQGDGKVRSGG